MPTPIALCLEDLAASTNRPRFTRCTALAGGGLGLQLDHQGDICWQQPAAGVCELWVSADERLMLFRPAGAPPVGVHRAGRSLDAPVGKPVVLLNQDELSVGPRRFRLHVHGQAPVVQAPEALAPTAFRAVIGRAAAAMAMGAAVAAQGIEVLANPPKVAAPPPPPPPPPIEVRETPPVVLPPREDPAPAATNAVRYIVKPGDTLAKIVRRSKGLDTAQAIAARNKLADADQLRPGQVLLVVLPTDPSRPTEGKK